VKETNQHMELPARAGKSPGRCTGVLKCPRRDLAGIIGRLRRRSNEPAQLSGSSACVRRGTVAKILLDDSLFRNRRPVIASIPARIAIKALATLLGSRERRSEQQRAHNDTERKKEKKKTKRT
jgi:hypothetical protein